MLLGFFLAFYHIDIFFEEETYSIIFIKPISCSPFSGFLRFVSFITVDSIKLYMKRILLRSKRHYVKCT